MTDVLKQPLEKRKRFTTVGVNDKGSPIVDHVSAIDANAAERLAIDSHGNGYVGLFVFRGYQTPL